MKKGRPNRPENQKSSHRRRHPANRSIFSTHLSCPELKLDDFPDVKDSRDPIKSLPRLSFSTTVSARMSSSVLDVAGERDEWQGRRERAFWECDTSVARTERF